MRKAVLCAVALFWLALSHHAFAADASGLVGLWGFEETLGPTVEGRLAIDRVGDGGRAEIAGETASVSFNGDNVAFVLPSGHGRFLGTLGASLNGFWIQPRSPTLGAEMATPIALSGDPAHGWRGDVKPLADTLRVYFDVTRNADGTLAAFLRNPELNYGRGRSLAVTVDGDNVAVRLAATQHIMLSGSYDPRSDTLSLEDPSQGYKFAFTRRDRAHAPGFYPRDEAAGAYVYHVPAAAADGWQTGSLDAVGLNRTGMVSMIQRIIDTVPTAGATPIIDSLLIARHGKLVLEEYFSGFDGDALHSLRSAGKTLTSILLGTAIDHGAPVSVRTAVYQSFPGYSAFANPDTRKQMMTVENLITMTSGLACDDDDEHSPGNEDAMQKQAREPDWYKFTLDLPMATSSGEKTAYCSAGVNLAGGVIRNVTHSTLLEMFRRYLAEPLQIRRYAINLTPTGDMYGGGGIRLRARDALKFGQLYLDGGVWNGERVVSKAWVDASLVEHSVVQPDSTYGYNWWRYRLRVGDAVYDEFEAGGNGGQFIMVVPALDLVVGIMGSNYGRFDVWYKFQTELLPDVILPMVTAQQ